MFISNSGELQLNSYRGILMSVNFQGINQDLLEFVLEHPYQCFQVNTDINQVIKNTRDLLKTKNIDFKYEDLD